MPAVFHREMDKEGSHKDICDLFKGVADKFTESPERKTSGRQHKLMPDEMIAAIVTHVAGILPQDFEIDMQKHPSLQKDTTTTRVAFAAERETATTEAGHLATLRGQIHGSRQVLCCGSVQLMKYLGARHKCKPATVKDANEFMKSLGSDSHSRDALKEFSRSNNVFVGTISTDDLMYMPPCYISMEKCGQKDCTSFRKVVVSKCHIEKMEEMSRLLQVQQPSAILTKALDSIHLDDA